MQLPSDEPKNGDFAAYVERLVAEASIRLGNDPGRSGLGSAASDTAGPGAPSHPAARQRAVPSAPKAPADALAELARRRAAGGPDLDALMARAVRFVVIAIFVVVVVVLAVGELAGGGDTIGTLLPFLVFGGFVAFQIWRRASRRR